MDWVLLHKKTNLFDNSNKSLLHVAPEPFFEKKFRRIPNLDYLSADLYSPKVMVKMDITDIQYPDNYFSAIYCSHVLEHVEEDRKALAELYRVLKEEGWAILEVPLSADKTYEDPSIKDPAGREQVFGQRDHVRLCGPDYIERMREAGFKTETILSGDLLTSDECLKMGIQPDRILFFCRK
jgi:SAM-dependent methyltransferase